MAQVEHDTLFPCFSVSKAVAAAALLSLVEDGLLSLDETLAGLWPTFAADTLLDEGSGGGQGQASQGAAAAFAAFAAAPAASCRCQGPPPRVAALQPLPALALL